MFLHSWASIGRTHFTTFKLEFTAKFLMTVPGKVHGYIGVGFRRHNVLAPFCHTLGLNRDGSITMAWPDETPNGYHDDVVREAHHIDTDADHKFRIDLTRSELSVAVDDCYKSFVLHDRPKMLGPGLIRFQTHLCRMGARSFTLSEA